MSTEFTLKGEAYSFGGKFLKLSHDSRVTNCTMNLNLFLPPSVAENPKTSSKKIATLLFLSGLTCTENNAAEKGFLHPYAATKEMAIIYPDTSPRGLNIPGEDDSYDLGTGAGFYVDATQSPWSKGYLMYSYVMKELLPMLFEQFNVLDKEKLGISGHSMGGHGALTLYLKNLDKFKCCTAFAPISNPSKSPWGRKALSNYLGPDEKTWLSYDATELIKNVPQQQKLKILIDVGTDDIYDKSNELLPENFVKAAQDAGHGADVKFRKQEHYDHGYYFVSTFTRDHVEFIWQGLIN